MADIHDIYVKRIYDPAVEEDGYRILIDRLWPRGVRKSDARLDEWNKNLAPSSALRKWFSHRAERVDEFSARYNNELLQQKTELTRIKEISKSSNVTLLYATKNPAVSHAPILQKTLKSLKP